MDSSESIEAAIKLHIGSNSQLDLNNLRRTIAQNVADALGNNPPITFDISVVTIDSPASFVACKVKQTVEIAVPVVLVDIVYNTSPTMAIDTPTRLILFRTVPDTVKDTVATFLSSKVKINKIRFVEPQLIMISGSLPGSIKVNSDFEQRLTNIQRQLREITQFLPSKL